jgi:fibronectin type 3 domain-containing protein
VSPAAATTPRWNWTTSAGASAHSVVVLRPAGSPATAPAPPTNVVATAGDGQVTLTWAAAAGATSYTVSRSLTPGGPYTVLASGLTGTSLTDTGLTNDTPYYYVVQAVNGVGASANSAEVTATPTCVTPAAPGSLGATAGVGTITLNWSAVTGASSYSVKRATTSVGPYTPVATGVAGTTYTDTTVAGGTTYFYVVTASSACGAESTNSPQASATPPTPPPAPANLTATPGDHVVGLTWGAATGATSYTVLRGLTPGGPYPTTVTSGLAATSFTNTGLTNGTALNVAGTSGASNEATGTPFCAVPGAPASLTATPGAGQGALVWAAVSGAASYSVKRATTSGGPYTGLTSGASTTSYTDTAVTGGTTYYYVVTALSACGGESGNAPEAAATPAVPPPGIALDAVSGLVQSANDATSLSYPFTVGSGLSNGLLLVLVPGYANPGASVASVTYGGLALTRVRRDGNGVNAAYSEAWYLVAPPAGLHAVVVTMTRNVDPQHAIYSGALSFSGVHQTTPIDAQAGSVVAGAHGTHADTVTPTTDQAWIVEGLASQQLATAVSGQTVQWAGGTANLERSGASVLGPVSPAAATTPRWNWTTSAGASAHSVVVLRPAP